jgi:HlyD family secretion protein
MITPKSSTTPSVAVGLLGLLASFTMLASIGPGSGAEANKQWRATAPGEVEPASGEIKIGSSVVGRIAQVLVKPDDKVFAGELLVRIEDDDLRAKVTVAEAQVALQKRLRNDMAAAGRAADRRKAEDAVADAEKAIVDAQAAVDAAATARRNGAGGDGPVASARAALARAQDRLKQLRGDLRKLDGQVTMPLPTQAEGQLNVARAELAYAHAVLEKMMIRAPIAGTVLQVNARIGELTSPSSAQPLVVLGDLSSLRVRAEVAEPDIGAVKLGQQVLVRAAPFRDTGFAGKVSSIAPSVEPLRMTAEKRRAPSDSKFVEVFVDLSDPGPLTVGMKVDVYFGSDTPK